MTRDNVISLQTPEDIESEASIWLMRLTDGEVSPELRAKFSEWVSRSARHREAFESISAFWAHLEIASQFLDYAKSDAAEQALKEEKRARTSRHYKTAALGGLVAAVATLCLYIGGARMMVDDPAVDPVFDKAFYTAIGQQKTVDLPDGSQILLNTDSAVRVAYDERARTIDLTQGEAFFDVASDPTRPFSVRTDNGAVTAIGTAFSVSTEARTLNVIVTEGRVAMTTIEGFNQPPSTDFSTTALEVVAGQSGQIQSGVKRVAFVEPEHLEDSLDWQDGILSFRGETLEQVALELQRYTSIKIEISDPELRHQKIVAYYTVGDPERMFEALNVMANIEVEKINDDHVRLYRVE